MKNLITIIILALSIYSAQGQNETFDIKLDISNIPKDMAEMKNQKIFTCLITNTGSETIPANSGLSVSCTNKDIIASQYFNINESILPGGSYVINVPLKNVTSDISVLSSFGVLVKLIKSTLDPVQLEYGNILSNNIVNFNFSSTILSDINVFPNPSLGNRDLNFSCIANVELFSFDGKMLMSSANVDKLDVSLLPSGIYYLSLSTNQTKHIKKIILN